MDLESRRGSQVSTYSQQTFLTNTFSSSARRGSLVGPFLLLQILRVIYSTRFPLQCLGLIHVVPYP